MKAVAGVFLLAATSHATQNSRTCIVNTGHTCNSGACPDSAGDAYCDTSTSSPRCFCNTGSCVGDDGADDSHGKRSPGKCHSGKTNVVAQGDDGAQVYQLRNARWPEYYLWVSNTNRAYVKKHEFGGSRVTDQERFNFNVLSPPGSATAAPIKLLTPTDYPNSALFAQPEQKCTTSDGKQTCSTWYPAVWYNVQGERDSIPNNNPSLVELGIKLERTVRKGPNLGRTLMMLGSPNEGGNYLFVHFQSYKVELYDGDPGANGYWYFEPELPQAMLDSIPEYNGRECFWWCRDIANLGENYTVGPNGTFVSGAMERQRGMFVAGIVGIMTLLSF